MKAILLSEILLTLLLLGQYFKNIGTEQGAITLILNRNRNDEYCIDRKGVAIKNYK